MEQRELEQLDALLHKLREDDEIVGELSVVEQREITGASKTICSLIRKHLKPRAQGPEA